MHVSGRKSFTPVSLVPRRTRDSEARKHPRSPFRHSLYPSVLGNARGGAALALVDGARLGVLYASQPLAAEGLYTGK